MYSFAKPPVTKARRQQLTHSGFAPVLAAGLHDGGVSRRVSPEASLYAVQAAAFAPCAHASPSYTLRPMSLYGHGQTQVGPTERPHLGSVTPQRPRLQRQSGLRLQHMGVEGTVCSHHRRQSRTAVGQGPWPPSSPRAPPALPPKLRLLSPPPTPPHPSPWENCLPWNRSLVPTRLGADTVGVGKGESLWRR